MQTETQVPDNGTPAAAPLVDLNAPPAGAPAPASATPPAEGAPVDPNTATPPADGTQQPNDGTDSGDRDDKGRFKSGVQKRIDELTFKRNQAEREAAHWRAIAEGKQAPAAPKASDFASDDDYQAALLDHRIQSGVHQGLAQNAQQTAQQFDQQAQAAAAETYNQRIAAAAARIPDFADVVGKADINISHALRDALMDSEHGPDIVYQLAKNPDEATRLSGLSVRQLDREIGRMEATLAAKAPAAAPAPAAARTTSAPPPVKPGNAAAAPASTDPNNMSQPEFEAWMRANGSRHVR